MPQFSYTALDNTGKRVSGTLSAKDKFDLSRQLKAESKTLIKAEDAGEHGGQGNIMARLNALVQRVTMHEKVTFSRNLSAMIKAGLPLSRALNILERQTKNEKFKTVLRSVREHIKKGGTLSDGMAEFPKVFPPLMVSMVHAGEESGGLAESLSVVGEQMDKSYRLQKKIRGAMIYPGIIICAMIVVGISMFIFVVPTLTQTFEEVGAELPPSTQIIIAISDLLSNHLFLFLFGIVGVVALFIVALRTKQGQRAFDYVVLRLPVIGNIVRQNNSARTARTMSSLLASGVDIVEGLGITGGVLQNSYYKEVIEEAKKSIQKGTPLSATFAGKERLYPILVSEMMEVGEETGRLSDMLGEIAIFYENEVEEATKNLSTIIEPVLMVVVGVGVGFFALSMITPVYSVLENI